MAARRIIQDSDDENENISPVKDKLPELDLQPDESFFDSITNSPAEQSRDVVGTPSTGSTGKKSGAH